LNGKVLLIQRDICKPGSHASEREIQELQDNDAFDLVIQNNGSLKDLFKSLKKLYVKLK
jgi:hypothetical protein